MSPAASGALPVPAGLLAAVLLAACGGRPLPAAADAAPPSPARSSHAFRRVRQRLQRVGISAQAGLHLLQRGAGRSSSQATAGIINGTVVHNSSEKFPFYAVPTTGPHSDVWLGCGASVISPTWAVSAAHCFGGGMEPCKGPQTLGLWLGDVRLEDTGAVSGMSGGRHYRTEARLVCHHDFDGKCSHGHDIALLHIKHKLPSWVVPVPLNLNGAGTDDVDEITNNMGFGLKESVEDPRVISPDTPSRMYEANLTILSDDFAGCASVYAGGYGCSDSFSEAPAVNKDQQLCAGASDATPRDTCSGDSGSPMLDKNGVQIGIVSYGGGPGSKMSGPGRICADPEYAGVYSRISSFSDFISSHVKDLPGR